MLNSWPPCARVYVVLTLPNDPGSTPTLNSPLREKCPKHRRLTEAGARDASGNVSVLTDPKGAIP